MSESRRHKVLIKRPSLGDPDAHGHRQETYSVFASRWASIEQIGRREIEFAKSISAAATHKVTINYTAGIDTTFIVVVRGRTFYVNGVTNPDEANVEMWLWCSERVNG